jgi:hypothetical protein
VTKIHTELHKNVVPIARGDPTNAERQRRYRERRRNANTKAGRNGRNGKRNGNSRNGRNGDNQQHIGVASRLARSSAAIRDAAKAAAEAANVIDFPASRHVPDLDEQPVTATPPEPSPPSGVMADSLRPATIPYIRQDYSPPEIAPSLKAPRSGRLAAADMLAYAVACGLAAIAAWFSLKGLAVLFPGAPHEIVVMGAIMEAAKLVACGWLAGAWRHVPWAFRGVLMLLIAGLAVINASGTFSQLTAAHVGSRAVSSAARSMQGTDLDSRIEVAAAKLADVDRRISSIDAIVAGAAQRGRANTAASIMSDQHKTRAALVAERERTAQALAELKVERGRVQARATIAESEAMPLRYTAELLGMGTDDEKAIRWLIALMVLCCDPLAIALTTAVSVRQSTSV